MNLTNPLSIDSTPCSTDGNYSNCFCGRSLEEFRYSHLIMYGIVAVIMCVIGLISNVFNVIVLTSKNTATSATNAILAGISVADILFLIFILIHTFLNYGVFTVDICLGFSYQFQLLSHISQRTYVTMHSISALLTLMLTIWRYFAVAFPLKMRQWCNLKRTILVIVICYLFGLLSNIPLYMRASVIEVNSIRKEPMIPTLVVNNGFNCTLYDIEFSEIATRNHYLFRNFAFWFRGMVLQLAPSFLLIVFSIILVRALHKSSQQRTTITFTSNLTTLEESCVRTTKIVLAVALLFLVTDLTQGIFLICSAVYGNTFYFTCYSDILEVNHFLIIVDCAFNFVIYIIMSKEFRRNFNHIFLKRLIRSKNGDELIESTML
ncbi:hypothetical protein CHUAL_009126 [Chamberlinius hualienensis]